MQLGMLVFSCTCSVFYRHGTWVSGKVMIGFKAVIGMESNQAICP